MKKLLNTIIPYTLVVVIITTACTKKEATYLPDYEQLIAAKKVDTPYKYVDTPYRAMYVTSKLIDTPYWRK